MPRIVGIDRPDEAARQYILYFMEVIIMSEKLDVNTESDSDPLSSDPEAKDLSKKIKDRALQRLGFPRYNQSEKRVESRRTDRIGLTKQQRSKKKRRSKIAKQSRKRNRK